MEFLFSFFFPPTWLKNPCRDSWTKEYSECCLTKLLWPVGLHRSGRTLVCMYITHQVSVRVSVVVDCGRGSCSTSLNNVSRGGGGEGVYMVIGEGVCMYIYINLQASVSVSSPVEWSCMTSLNNVRPSGRGEVRGEGVYMVIRESTWIPK